MSSHLNGVTAVAEMCGQLLIALSANCLRKDTPVLGIPLPSLSLVPAPSMIKDDSLIGQRTILNALTQQRKPKQSF